MLPTVTLPKLRLEGLGDRSPAESPVPDSAIVREGFEAFDVIVTLPLAAPAAAGANFTLKVVFVPAANVTGVVMPLTLNPVPLTVTCEIVTDEPPVLVIFSDRV